MPQTTLCTHRDDRSAIDTPQPTLAPTGLPASVWTAETIYKSPLRYDNGFGQEVPPKVSWRDLCSSVEGWLASRYKFTPEFIDALSREDPNAYQQQIAIRLLTAEEKRAIVAGESCPICGVANYSDNTAWALHRGAKTGIELMLRVPCPCSVAQDFGKQWRLATATTPRFRDVHLHQTEPTADSTKSILPVERQRQIIKLLRAHPADSFLLHGPPNTGKTHMMTGLHREAVMTWAQNRRKDQVHYNASCIVWRIDTSELLDQHVAWERRDQHNESDRTPMPVVTPEKIRHFVRHGIRVCLFLDEIDKFKATEFKMTRLLAIINAVYEGQGQIVASSNASIDQLMERWGENEAGTALRRIALGEGCHNVYFG